MINFRKFTTNSGLNVVGGKDAESNDRLVWDASPNDFLLHTDAPGSPFVNIGESPSKKDIDDSAIFCAKYSKCWRDSKRDIIVNKFLRHDMKKSKMMKAGSWEVKHQDIIRVKRADILKFEEVLKNETN